MKCNANGYPVCVYSAIGTPDRTIFIALSVSTEKNGPKTNRGKIKKPAHSLLVKCIGFVASS